MSERRSWKINAASHRNCFVLTIRNRVRTLCLGLEHSESIGLVRLEVPTSCPNTVSGTLTMRILESA
eukprot:6163569-Pyramimonas_sp.AAC.1